MSDVASTPCPPAAGPPGRRLPLGFGQDGEMTRTATVLAFMLGTLAVFTAVPFGVLGVLLSDAGRRRIATAPDSARRLVAWSWGVLAVTDALVVITVIALVMTLSG